MSSPVASSDVIVVGAGVLGLCSAAELAGRGRRVLVVDPGGPNASSVAAGMIAPAAEALADYRASGGLDDHSDLFRRARDLWPAFAARAGIALHREGVEWRGPDSEQAADLWGGWGFLDGDPALSGPVAPGDWRLDPVDALARLSAVEGVTRRVASVFSIEPTDDGWRLTLDDGGCLQAPAVILATGHQALDAPDEIQRLFRQVSPIRGQMAVMPDLGLERVIRGADGYASPAAGCSVIGASMEPGRTDLTPDPQAGRAQLDACLAMIGSNPVEPLGWRVGVRGATPDGLPMAGAVEAHGLFVALAPRRNGWLLGPLVGQVVAQAVEGDAAAIDAAALDPKRFL